MQRSRRAILAAVPVALAGCGQSLRENTVPGGLDIRNRRSGSITVAVRAAVLPELRTEGGDGVGQDSATSTPVTPRDADLEPPDASGEYTVAAESALTVPDFFSRAGRWGVEAVLNPDAEAAADWTRIELFAALAGPTGADTLVVEATADGLTARATTVD